MDLDLSPFCQKKGGGGLLSFWEKFVYPCLKFVHSFIHSFSQSFIPLACSGCDNSLPFSGSSSIPICYVLFPATPLHQQFFHPTAFHLAINFLVYISVFLFPNSYIIPFWESYFLPFSVHAQTNVIYLTLLSLFIVGFLTIA